MTDKNSCPITGTVVAYDTSESYLWKALVLCINFHEITCVRDSCKSHVYDARDTSKSKQESFGLKV